MRAGCPTDWGAAIVDELCRQGVRHFCVSPGSRSTPLALAAGRREDVQTHVFIDERSSAFFAMGVGKATGAPAAVITTSGTAMANAYPAVLESEATGTPLVLVSADRPPELRKSGANQTIDQPGLFGAHVRFFFDLPCPGGGMGEGMLRGVVSQAHAASIHPVPGPVHLNAMFRKPLDSGLLPSLEAGGAQWVRSSIPKLLPSEEDAQELAELVRTSRRGLAVLGAMDSCGERSAAAMIAERLGWPVLADAASGLRLHPFERSVAPADFLFQEPGFLKMLDPDVVLHIGGPLVSKEYGRWLGGLEARHVCVQGGPFRYGPGNTGTWRLPCSAAGLAEGLEAAGAFGKSSQCRNRQDWFARLRRECEAALADLLDGGFTEGGILRALLAELGEEALFLSNSMPVRDLNRYAQTLQSPVRTGCSRGASGIDGIISTAAGWTLGQERPGVALLGDIAAWHDLGAVLQLGEMDVPLLLVVVNNGGGSIFSRLPWPEKDALFSRLFTAQHGHRFAPIFQASGIPCLQPESIGGFREALGTLRTGRGLRAIEVVTDPTENAALSEEAARRIRKLAEAQP